MIVFRLCKSKFSNDLSGRGAELCGGRWNSRGVAMLYTSQSRALCTAEIAVHLPLGIIPVDYVLTCVEFPDSVEIQQLAEADLPADWKSIPYSQSTCQLGNAFIQEAGALVLKVPSAVVSGDFNFLINPAHPEFSKVKQVSTEPFGFDERLFVR